MEHSLFEERGRGFGKGGDCLAGGNGGSRREPLGAGAG